MKVQAYFDLAARPFSAERILSDLEDGTLTDEHPSSPGTPIAVGEDGTPYSASEIKGRVDVEVDSSQGLAAWELAERARSAGYSVLVKVEDGITEDRARRLCEDIDESLAGADFYLRFFPDRREIWAWGWDDPIAVLPV